jgi:hypothetical protein
MPSIDAPPLPDRYEVDEIVAIAVDPITLYFYWEVRPITLAHARATHPDGWLCVRVAAVTATWEGPVVETRDLRIDGLSGDRFLRDIQPGSNLRLSVGWLSAAGFEPFAVGSEVAAPRAVPVETVAQEVARWEAEPMVAPGQTGVGQHAPGPMPRHVPPILSPSASVARAWSVHRQGGHEPAPVHEEVLPPVLAPDTAGAAASLGGGPVDTGVEVWGAVEEIPGVEATPPEEEEWEDAPTVEDGPGWFEGAVGSSELGRSGPTRRLRPARGRRLIPGAPGAPGRPGIPGAWPPGRPTGAFEVPGRQLGGASDLGPGGASELSR